MNPHSNDANVASFEFTVVVRCVSFLLVFLFMMAFFLVMPS